MNLPGFTAEASVYQTIEFYHLTATPKKTTTESILPQIPPGSGDGGDGCRPGCGDCYSPGWRTCWHPDCTSNTQACDWWGSCTKTWQHCRGGVCNSVSSPC